MSSTDPANDEHSNSARPAAKKQTPATARLALAIAWCGFVLLVGAIVATYSTIHFDHLGMLVVWPVGWAGGVVAAKILDGKSKLVGGVLVATCFAINLIALVYWIRSEIVQANDSWATAVGLLPTFFREWPLFSIIAVVVAFSAGWSAWQQVTVQYVRLRIDSP